MEVVFWFGILGKYWYNLGCGIVIVLYFYWFGMNVN